MNRTIGAGIAVAVAGVARAGCTTTTHTVIIKPTVTHTVTAPAPEPTTPKPTKAAPAPAKTVYVTLTPAAAALAPTQAAPQAPAAVRPVWYPNWTSTPPDSAAQPDVPGAVAWTQISCVEQRPRWLRTAIKVSYHP